MHNTIHRIVGLTALAGFGIGSLLAVAPPAATADEADPGVARISLLDGGVDVKRVDSGDSFAAAVNAPLSAGDYLTTRDDARAELQLDDETELRVAPATQLRFTNLTATANALQLAQGTVELRLFHGTDANPEVDTPNASIRPSDNGAYRVSVDENGNSIVTVRAGSATVAMQNSSQDISEGNSVEIDGGSQDAQLRSIPTVASDAFDGFNVARDSKEASAQSYAYVDDQIVGANDLDQYGSWQNTGDYGEVWHPDAGPNWAPYSDGNWTWEPYYGWTWVSAEPWGWAPYHYGRWFYARDDGGWCWTPATRYAAPIYAPAQVAFFSFGFGNGGGISIGLGNIGWIPLGPHDSYSPWWGGYGYGRGGYGGVTTITNITNVTNIYNYHNVNAPGGIVAVGNANFQHGDFRQRVNVTPAQLRTANIAPVRGVVPVLPTTRNLAFNPRESAPAAAAPLSPSFRRFKPLAASVAAHPFSEQRAAVSALAQRAYPNDAPAFEREAPALSDARPQTFDTRTAPLATREDTQVHATSALRSDTQSRSPWDRFDSAGAGSSRTKPEVASGRALDASGTSEPARREDARPSYARPDTTTQSRALAEPKAVAPTPAEPRVIDVARQRSTNGAWDRFGSQTRANANGDDARPSYARPQAPRTVQDGAYSNGTYAPAHRDYSATRTGDYSRPARTEPAEHQTTERNASSGVRPAPAERAPAEHARPAESQAHSAPAKPDSSDREHH
jgi:hypothetical protein